ncbi:SCF ubiquitin ligase complex subunit cdc4, partial [Rhizophlyctis rosea]
MQSSPSISSPLRGNASSSSKTPSPQHAYGDGSSPTLSASGSKSGTSRTTAAQFALAPHSVTTTVVTTTTTTTTAYPPLYIPPAPQAGSSHDYPLAHTPTPPVLKKFCFDLNGVPTHFRELDLLDSEIEKNFGSVRKPGASVSVKTTTTTKSGSPSHLSLPASIHRSFRSNPFNSPSRRNLRKRTAPGESDEVMTAAEMDYSPVSPNAPGSADGKVRAHKRRLSNNTLPSSGNQSTPQSPRHDIALTPTTPISIPTNQTGIQSPNLPSPRLSPTGNPSSHFPADLLQPMNLSERGTPEPDLSLNDGLGLHRSLHSNHLSPALQQQLELPPGMADSPSLADVPRIIQTFDMLPPPLKSYLLLHLLRRCPFSTLQFISTLILPTLKRDFIGLLPVELSYQILGYLDLKTLGRSSAVSKAWKRVVDGEGAEIALWKKRLQEEGWYHEDEVKKEIRKASHTERKGKGVIELGLDPLKISTSHVTAPPSPPSGPSNDLYDPMDESDDEHFDNSQTSVNGRHQYKQQSPETEEPQPPPHLYKNLFRRHHLIRQNWFRGKYKHISFPGHAHNVVTCLQFDGDKIVSGSDDQTIHIYSTKTGELQQRLEGHEGGVWALQYSGYTLVSGSTDRTVRVWDMETGKCTHLFEGHTSTVRCLMIVSPQKSTDFPGTMEPDVPLIVTGSRDATLRVWRLPDPKRDPEYNPGNNNGSSPPSPDDGPSNPYFMHVLNGHTSSVRAIAGQGNVLVSGSYDTTVRIWDLRTGDAVHVCRGHREKVYSVGYCHELRRAVSGSMDASVRVWCTRTGVGLFVLEGHSSLVGLLELSAQYLVSAAADSTLRIWCPMTGKCLANLTGHAAAITCFHHDPKLNRIVSGSDGGVKVWELSSAGYGNTTNPDQYAKVASGLAYTQGPNGPEPVHGRFIKDLVGSVAGVWRVKMDERRLVCAVQKEGSATWFEVLDFGDGVD